MMRGRSGIFVNLSERLAGMSEPRYSTCTWCGNPVEPGDGYRLMEHAGDRGAAFCRLEHVVPWVIQGAHWQAGEPKEPSSVELPTSCSECGGAVGEAGLVLVRHRGEHRIADAFCS